MQPDAASHSLVRAMSLLPMPFPSYSGSTAMIRHSPRRAIGHGERDDLAGVFGQPALGGVREALRDALRIDAVALQLLERHRVLARSGANVEKRRHVGGGDLAELHDAHSSYLLGSYRIATAPEPNSSRLMSFKSTCFDSPAN